MSRGEGIMMSQWQPRNVVQHGLVKECCGPACLKSIFQKRAQDTGRKIGDHQCKRKFPLFYEKQKNRDSQYKNPVAQAGKKCKKDIGCNMMLRIDQQKRKLFGITKGNYSDYHKPKKKAPEKKFVVIVQINI